MGVGGHPEGHKKLGWGGGTNMQMGDTYMMEEVYIWSIEI